MEKSRIRWSGINIPDPGFTTLVFTSSGSGFVKFSELTGNEDNTAGLAAEVHQPPHLLPKIWNILGYLLMFTFKRKKTLKSATAARLVNTWREFRNFSQEIVNEVRWDRLARLNCVLRHRAWVTMTDWLLSPLVESLVWQWTTDWVVQIKMLEFRRGFWA